VVADLLEGRDGGQDGALGGSSSAAGGQEPVEHRLVQADLLGGHRAVVELVDPLGQLGGHLGLGLGAAEHQDAVERPQGALAAGLRFSDSVSWLTKAGGTRQAGVGEVEDRPQVAEAVLDRGAGEGHAGAGIDAAQLLGGLVGRVLDGLGLVEHDPVPRRWASASMSRTAVP
jgi:hypothetical protein